MHADLSPDGPLHIVEPRLSGHAGHCHSLVDALVRAAGNDQPVVVWAQRDATVDWPGDTVRVEHHFSPRWRRLQSLLLYRRLLRAPGRVLVATAGTADLVLARLAAGGRAIAPGKLFMLMHWLGHKSRKVKLLSRVARRQPGIDILAVTPSVQAFFAACGFRSRLVPYPVAPPDRATMPVSDFRHLLVAGSARADKGFKLIVELVEQMRVRAIDWPVVVQVSSEGRHGHDEVTLALIERLRRSGQPGLRLVEHSLTPDQYTAMFRGAVVVQPYDAAAFADRVSGVTLDAMRHGAPLVVTANSWMARQVQLHSAGRSVDAPGVEPWLQAIGEVVNAYQPYATRSRAAGAEMPAEHAEPSVIGLILARVSVQ